jgi:hypothetical protein
MGRERYIEGIEGIGGESEGEGDKEREVREGNGDKRDREGR